MNILIFKLYRPGNPNDPYNRTNGGYPPGGYNNPYQPQLVDAFGKAYKPTDKAGADIGDPHGSPDLQRDPERSPNRQ